MASKQVIVCVHGAGPKPPEEQLREFWREALRQGVARTQAKALTAFDASELDMVYWASNAPQEDYDVQLDLQQRRLVLDQLADRRKGRDFRRRHYDALPGKSPLKEFAMDTAASIGVASLLWPRLMPQLKSYWQDDDGWASKLRASLAQKLARYVDDDREVLLVTHCMGTILVYDTLVQTELSTRIPLWVTLGSPIASNSVRRRLIGYKDQSFPTNLVQWHNLSAEDDYVCHDKAVGNDFSAMLDRRLIGDIRDHAIYNLAVRYGRSNPHHSAGYLAHPRMADLLGNWLLAQPLSAEPVTEED